MQFTDKRNITRWFIILISFVIVVLILWNTYNFFQIFKNEERIRIELWTTAQKTLANANEYTDVELPFQVISNNSTIPMIVTDSIDHILSFENIELSNERDTVALKRHLQQMKTENQPIKMEIAADNYQLVYYGNSPLLNKLKYYPIALLLIIFLFAAVVYVFYRATKMAGQNKLWAGMAKETAHQIGTPLSSLIGWVEILKTENVDEDIVSEVEKDVNRLQTITDRFSKIGSEPVLEKLDIVSETKMSFEYLKTRTSKQVEFHFQAPNHPVEVNINPALHSWTIENLVKNAIDAMRGKGKLKVEIEELAQTVQIRVSDTGKGIPKNQFQKIFEPGFTTKKRGWGLGLSLTKRIVEDYHKGRIKVVYSEIGKGTTIQISLKKNS